MTRANQLLFVVWQAALAVASIFRENSDDLKTLEVSIPTSPPINAILAGTLAIPCHITHLVPFPTPTLGRQAVLATPRVKWTFISDGKEVEILVARGQKVKISEEYRSRVSLPYYSLFPTDATLELSNLRSNDSGIYRCDVQYGIEDDHALLEVKVKGVVFLYRDGARRYAFTFSRAQEACTGIMAQVATAEQLFAAYEGGYEQCDAGWLADQTVRYPIQTPREACYGDMDEFPGVRNYGVVDPEEKYDVYCYIEDLHGEVFLGSVPGKFSLAEGKEHCKREGADLATPGQLYAAWNEGMDHCNPGWLSDGSVRYPIVSPRERCGGNTPGVKTIFLFRNQTGFPDSMARYDVYCFREITNSSTESPMDYQNTQTEGVQEITDSSTESPEEYESTQIEGIQQIITITEKLQELKLGKEAAEREARGSVESATVPGDTNGSEGLRALEEATPVSEDPPATSPDSLGSQGFLQQAPGIEAVDGAQNLPSHEGSGFSGTESGSLVHQGDESDFRTEAAVVLREGTSGSVGETTLGPEHIPNSSSEVSGRTSGQSTTWEDGEQVPERLVHPTETLPGGTSTAGPYTELNLWGRYATASPTDFLEPGGSGSFEGTSQFDPMILTSTASKEHDADPEERATTHGTLLSTLNIHIFKASSESDLTSDVRHRTEEIPAAHLTTLQPEAHDRASDRMTGENAGTEGRLASAIDQNENEDTYSENGVGLSGSQFEASGQEIHGTFSGGPATESPHSPRWFMDGSVSGEASGVTSEHSPDPTGHPEITRDQDTSEGPTAATLSVASTAAAEFETIAEIQGDTESETQDGSTSHSHEGSGEPSELLLFEATGISLRTKPTAAEPEATVIPLTLATQEASRHLDLNEASGAAPFSVLPSTDEPLRTDTMQPSGQVTETSTSHSFHIRETPPGTKNQGSLLAHKFVVTETSVELSTSPVTIDLMETSFAGIGEGPGAGGYGSSPSLSRLLTSADELTSPLFHNSGEAASQSSGGTPAVPLSAALPRPALPTEKASLGAALNLTDECIPNPCHNGGTCMEMEDRVTCLCLPGHGGDLCETSVRECQRGWDKFQGFCYQHFLSRKNWEEAELDCRNYGGHLVSIMSPEEQSFINSRYKNYQWTGLNDKTIEGDFQWSDGNPLLYENWHHGQPDSYFLSGEDCVVIVSRDQGEWSDVPCNYHLSYTCKMGLVSCGFPPEVENALVFGKPKSNYEINSIVRYRCHGGFIQHNSPIIRCQEDGQWEQPHITCAPNTQSREPLGTVLHHSQE
uniref:Brevican core protein n=1 Tax=Geotrypetes seraphini TaxID=260995 RepID=A0A6P8PW70_GEOSA|nr:brevican core protein [Geotrypetes seraphini]XP_033779058.1 brevican core protein [Geotrypetes seraphini]